MVSMGIKQGSNEQQAQGSSWKVQIEGALEVGLDEGASTRNRILTGSPSRRNGRHKGVEVGNLPT